MVDEANMRFDHENLDVYSLSIDFVAAAWAIIDSLPKGHGDLAGQLRRASTSIPLNIAEGAGEFSRADKARFYRFAKRSATECAAIIDVGQRLDAIEDALFRAARELLLRIVGMLVKIVRSLSGSG